MTQRPAEIDPTILSQCNTVFALRMSNERDQEIVTSALSDTSTGLLEFLPALGHREAIAFGEGVSLPVRIRFDEMPAHFLPRSTTARFSEKWQNSVGDEGFLDSVVERWRAAGVCGGVDAATQAQMFADTVQIPTGAPQRRPELEQPPESRYQPAAPARDSNASARTAAQAPSAAPPRSMQPPPKSDMPPAGEQAPVPGSQNTLNALRERLMRPSTLR